MKIIYAIMLVIAIASAAYASDMLTMNVGTAGPGGGGGCTNSLDFSQACNSQYLL